MDLGALGAKKPPFSGLWTTDLTSNHHHYQCLKSSGAWHEGSASDSLVYSLQYKKVPARFHLLSERVLLAHLYSRLKIVEQRHYKQFNFSSIFSFIQQTLFSSYSAQDVILGFIGNGEQS